MPSLDGVHAKLARAEKHIETRRTPDWILRTKHMRHSPKPNPETNEIDAFVHLPDPPQAISLILGDAVHNMRSALDHLVYQLVIANAVLPTDKTMFPICDTEEGFLSQAYKRRRLIGVTHEPFAHIQAVQPYNLRKRGGQFQTHPLWILDKLENIDKHRRIATTAGLAVGAHTTITTGTGEVRTHSHDIGTVRLRDGAKLLSFAPPTHSERTMEVKGLLMTTVAFNEPAVGLPDSDAAGVLARFLIGSRSSSSTLL